MSRKHVRRRQRNPWRNRIIILVTIVTIALGSLGVYELFLNSQGSNSNQNGGTVLLTTSMGNITIQLYDDMPITTNNFRNLVLSHYYDGTIFHRVVTNCTVQGGVGDYSAPSIQDEGLDLHRNLRGTVAMAKTNQPNSATSQFYFNVVDRTDLDTHYSVFGTVISGMDVVDSISRVPIIPSERGPNDGKPVQNVTLISARLIG